MATLSLGHREDTKYPSTCLARKWHVQLVAPLNFKANNINQRLKVGRLLGSKDLGFMYLES